VNLNNPAEIALAKCDGPVGQIETTAKTKLDADWFWLRLSHS